MMHCNGENYVNVANLSHVLIQWCICNGENMHFQNKNYVNVAKVSHVLIHDAFVMGNVPLNKW